MECVTENLPGGLTLRQDTHFFKLGQDSVLLARAFAAPKKGDRVLDLGCGIGALSLMLYRPELRITGLELQEGALDLFRKSINDNGVDIRTVHGDLREIESFFANGSMDYVVCNPPYFVSGSGKPAAAHEKRLARQDSLCSIEQIAKAAAYVLHPGGRAAFVFRPERLAVLLRAMGERRLAIKRLRFVHQNAEANPSAVLAEFRRDGAAEGLCVEPPLFVESLEYKRIYCGGEIK